MQPIWQGVYRNHKKINQFDGAIENQYSDIQRDKLLYFNMTCSSSCSLRINLETGELYKNNNKIHNHTLQRIENKSLDYSGGLIQYKEASVLVSDTSTSEELLKTANIGYKVTNNNTLYQFILTYSFGDYRTWLQIKVTDLTTNNIIDSSRYAV